MKTVQLGDILTSEQIEAAVKILRETPDTIDAARKLKAYLHPFAAELLKKGAVAEYMAYFLVASKDRLLALDADRN